MFVPSRQQTCLVRCTSRGHSEPICSEDASDLTAFGAEPSLTQGIGAAKNSGGNGAAIAGAIIGTLAECLGLLASWLACLGCLLARWLALHVLWIGYPLIPTCLAGVLLVIALVAVAYKRTRSQPASLDQQLSAGELSSVNLMPPSTLKRKHSDVATLSIPEVQHVSCAIRLEC